MPPSIICESLKNIICVDMDQIISLPTAARESAEISPSSEIAKKPSRLMVNNVSITTLRRKLAVIRSPVNVSMARQRGDFYSNMPYCHKI